MKRTIKIEVGKRYKGINYPNTWFDVLEKREVVNFKGLETLFKVKGNNGLEFWHSQDFLEHLLVKEA